MTQPRSPRARTLLKAVARHGSGNLTTECIVRDMSRTGARLQLAEAAILPSEFRLEIPQRGVAFQCELRWRRAEMAGIAFKDTGDAPRDDASRIDELERENAALKRELARLRDELESRGASI